MELIYKEIIDQLKANVPELRYIAPDDGQLDIEPDEEGNYPVLLPCALIEIEGIDWTSTEWTEQTGEGTLTIRYGWRQPARLDNLSSNSRITDATQRWAIALKIAKALHGFSGTGFGELERNRTEREKKPGSVKVFNISFGFSGSESLAP